MRFIDGRTFARPALWMALALAAGVFVIGMLAGWMRLLPLVLAPGFSLALVVPLSHQVAGVSFEIACFVAIPLSFAITASRLVERGEARALFALGARPRTVLVSAWPAAALLCVMSGAAAASWGAGARAPGRSLASVVESPRSACASEATAGRIGSGRIPLVNLSWVCFPGEPPRLVGQPAPLGATAFSATSIELSDDLRSATLSDVVLTLRGEGAPHLVLRAHFASFRGLSPVTRASNLGAAQRAAVLTGSALALAAALTGLVFVRTIASRVVATAVGACGVGASLLTFSALEGSMRAPLCYALVPAAGLGVVVLAWIRPR